MNHACCCQPQEGALIDALYGSVDSAALAADCAAATAEGVALRYGTVVYHYFEGTREPGNQKGLPLWKIIYIDQRVGSRVLCLTEEEIARSVAAASAQVRPHYGDGAYCTLHADFPHAQPQVGYAHGIDPRICQYRAVLVLEQPERFRKFPATGGVIRSVPREAWLNRDDLVKIGASTGEARLLRIEVYVDGEWRRVPPP